MAKTPTSAILTTIRRVEELSEVVANHERVLAKLIDRLEALDSRMTALESARTGTKGRG